MKSIILKTTLLLFVVVFIPSLCACSNLDEYAGEWHLVGVALEDGTVQSYEEVGIDAPEYKIVIEPDGKVEYTYSSNEKSNTLEGTCKEYKEGITITLGNDSGQSYHCTKQDGYLYFDVKEDESLEDVMAFEKTE